jgi:hypothetical protein
MNDVVTGSETEGSLHVVTGSKDRSLRLYKVVVTFYFFSFHRNIFLISYIMHWTP